MEKTETVLVTGGTGFVGVQIILQLLQKGYKVHTTLRSLNSKKKVIETLKSNGIMSFDNLTFFETNLIYDDNWAKAMQGCKYVLSVASPVFFEIPKDEKKAMRPAIEGILRILKFAQEANVKRVVLTSSFGAVGFSHTDKTTETTEEDWTNPNLKGLSAYEKSKGLSERAAWNYIKKEGGNLELSVINPVAILGPSLSPHISGSFDLLKNLLDGSMKIIPNLPLNIVDVRDVADLHIRAMTHPKAKGQRFIASADGQISLPEIAKLLKEKNPEAASKLPLTILPNWILNLAALFNNQAKTGSMFLKVNRNVSNVKAKSFLGWMPIANNEQAILASLDSMIKYGIIK
ncbi:nucleoside-diphosphate-sugar epimerase [Tenacibaculum adriaticum]|uniref:Nucleoside-diphosphate-sugar epimerase n=1 Tax=Tenacibaculum adriaticum TaxID=413713 RepID=A0A5S5DNJ5_9FLAO|nr:aldehyde reductase [Tenacibaculum adriaticum]TYP97487.1 nucleoside-diphosphate-sugar epimerase [Tenacibaculum adriaticum]